ncbi:MAG: type II secretion system protein [Myxococcota bacterium]
MSLLEVMVVIAIVLGLTAVLVPGARSLFALKQRSAARNLAMAIERFHDEAVMRNRSFRITFFLDEGKYSIEAGEAGALIAAGPEEREAYEAEVRGKLENMTEEQKLAWKHSNRQPFEMLEVAGKMEIELPAGVRFGGVYTPQYGRIVHPGEKLEGQDKDEPLRVFTYVMNSGVVERTIVWLVDADDPNDGWTVEVEPLSGVVRLHGELVDPTKDFDFIPTEGPSLPN